MKLTVVRASLILVALAGAVLTTLAATRPMVRLEPRAPQSAVPPTGGQQTRHRVDRELVRRTIERPPFRADRRAPVASFDPERPAVTERPVEPAPPRPPLAVSGIVWGDEPAAVVEGLPGIEGSVVLRLGESRAGIKVIGIKGDRVVIRGMDTTWRLTVREPWQ